MALQDIKTAYLSFKQALINEQTLTLQDKQEILKRVKRDVQNLIQLAAERLDRQERSNQDVQNSINDLVNNDPV